MMIDTKEYPQGLLFSEKLQQEVRNRFYNIDHDNFGKRIFFENSGGALRLKSCIQAVVDVDSHPDCPGRHQQQADVQDEKVKRGYEDLRIIFNTQKGSIITYLSASQVMFNIIESIANNIEGKNMVVSVLEHPSGFDSVQYYAEKTGRELRVLQPNRATGRIDVEEVQRLVDKDTVVLSCMYSSNTTGGVNDIPAIVKAARAIKPDIYIVVDAVQHAPHGLIDLSHLDIDAMDFAPYKFFACRGSGVGWVSERCARLPHNHILCYSDDTWELGSTAPHIFAGFSAIVDHVAWIGRHFIDSSDRRTLFAEGIKRIALQERALLYRTLEGTDELSGLRHISNIEIICDNPDLTQRDYILPIIFKNMDVTSAVKEYIKRGIYVFERKSPNHYSKRIVESLGLEGVVRVSPIHCNSPKEIDDFLKASAEIAKL
ncbi:aminotransferase class V-fold PLP-dependent enzyme [Megasphaera paucivorans]|uniref:Selenocysteine lyase/Cysteine desulfurase n=1 Tax=Megasphaera paucivorans TaxID=349095 RepID=A0A1H0AL39_9FIRM|nr:aminotransferase class V-fold PLP-dependent enzyme [Megasphaera paucivorans]SDN34302.1 Selenocysteine lyase/Cysteine desulfurase [Megasphaera paucivorans]